MHGREDSARLIAADAAGDLCRSGKEGAPLAAPFFPIDSKDFYKLFDYGFSILGRCGAEKHFRKEFGLRIATINWALFGTEWYGYNSKYIWNQTKISPTLFRTPVATAVPFTHTDANENSDGETDPMSTPPGVDGKLYWKAQVPTSAKVIQSERKTAMKATQDLNISQRDLSAALGSVSTLSKSNENLSDATMLSAKAQNTTADALKDLVAAFATQTSLSGDGAVHPVRTTAFASRPISTTLFDESLSHNEDFPIGSVALYKNKEVTVVGHTALKVKIGFQDGKTTTVLAKNLTRL